MKKMFMSLSSLATIAAPIAFAVSCGGSEDNEGLKIYAASNNGYHIPIDSNMHLYVGDNIYKGKEIPFKGGKWRIDSYDVKTMKVNLTKFDILGNDKEYKNIDLANSKGEDYIFETNYQGTRTKFLIKRSEINKTHTTPEFFNRILAWNGYLTEQEINSILKKFNLKILDGTLKPMTKTDIKAGGAGVATSTKAFDKFNVEIDPKDENPIELAQYGSIDTLNFKMVTKPNYGNNRPGKWVATVAGVKITVEQSAGASTPAQEYPAPFNNLKTGSFYGVSTSGILSITEGNLPLFNVEEITK